MVALHMVLPYVVRNRYENRYEFVGRAAAVLRHLRCGPAVASVTRVVAFDFAERFAIIDNQAKGV